MIRLGKILVAALLASTLLTFGCANRQVERPLETIAEAEVEVQKAVNLGMTPEEFRNRYNQIALQIDAPVMKAENFVVYPPSDSPAFIGLFDSRINLAGTVTSDGKMDFLFVSTKIFSHFSVAFDSSKEIYAAIIYALSPEVDASEVWEIVKKFGQDKNNYSEYRAEKVIYGKVVLLDDDESLMFMVKPRRSTAK